MGTRGVSVLIPVVIAAAIFGGTLPLVSAQDSPGSAPADGADGARITYVGNAGFLIERGEHKVLIDALYRTGVPGYVVHSKELQTQQENGHPPFDDIDLVLATHVHTDHFEPNSVGKFLNGNQQAKALTSFQAADRLMRVFPGFELVKDRVQAYYPSEGDKEKISFDGIDVTIMTMHHGRSIPFQNIAFLVEIDGFKVLHMGDAQVGHAELARYQLQNEEIDVALVPFWLLLEYRGVKMIQTTIASRKVFPMHLPVEGAPSILFGSALNRPGALRLLETLPGAILIDQPLDSRFISK